MDWTLRLTDLILLLITVAGVPLVRLVARTLLDLRESMHDMQRVIGGTAPPSGLVGDILAQGREIQRLREWQIAVGADVTCPTCRRVRADHDRHVPGL